MRSVVAATSGGIPGKARRRRRSRGRQRGRKLFLRRDALLKLVADLAAAFAETAFGIRRFLQDLLDGIAELLQVLKLLFRNALQGGFSTESLMQRSTAVAAADAGIAVIVLSRLRKRHGVRMKWRHDRVD